MIEARWERLCRRVAAFALAALIAVPTGGAAFADQLTAQGMPDAGQAAAQGGQSGQALQAATAAAGGAQAAAVGVQAAAEAPTPWDGSADTTWYDAGKTAFTLTTPAQVAGLAAIASGTAEGFEQDSFAGKTVTLGADLVLNEGDSRTNWKPIADINRYDGTNSSSETFFDGTFDGAGHKVFGLFIEPADFSAASAYGGYQAFFGSLGPHAVVRDLGIESGKVSGRVAAGIAAVSHVKSMRETPRIIGCYNKADIVGNGSSTRATGGIFGGEDKMGASESSTVTDDYRGAARIYDCFNQGTVTSTGPAGGIAGMGSVQLRGCYNSGTVRSRTDGSTAVGALVANLLAPGYLTTGDLGANGLVENSYALSTSCVNLYRIYDADHDSLEPGFPQIGAKSTVNFLSAGDLSVASPLMGTSFVDDSLSDPSNGRYPLLFWQAGLSPVQMSDAYVAPIPDQKYTASAVRPDVEVRMAQGAAKLMLGTDYLVSYQDNVDAGTATVVLEGLGRYRGTRSDVTFQIVELSLSDCTIEPIGGQWFYGDPVTPEVVVRTPNDTKLEEGVDFTASFEDNDRPGQATVTISPKGEGVGGTNSATFIVVGASSQLEGEGTADKPYLISSKGDFQLLSRLVNTGVEGYADAHYKMTCDIDASPTDESPVTIDSIGMKLHPFAGSFDGGGYTVTLGMRLSELSSYIFEEEYDNGWMNLALFANTPNARDDEEDGVRDSVTIENLTIDGWLESSYSVSAFVGNALADRVTLRNCTNKARVTRTDGWGTNDVAGLVAYAGWFTHLDMENCANEGIVSGGRCTGGLIGEGVASTIALSGCVNRGTVSGNNVVSGIMAEFQPDGTQSQGAHFTMKNCANEGTVATTYDYGAAGGLLGAINESYSTYSDEACLMAGCYNSGAVTGAEGVGGLVGKVYHTPLTVSGCYNAGTVTNRKPGEIDRASGIAGYLAGSGSAPWAFASVYNAGTLVNEGGEYEAAGILGCAGYGSASRFFSTYFADDTAEHGIAVERNDGWLACQVEGAPESIARTRLAAKGAEGGAYLLGASFADDGEGGSQLNGGLPVLYWQAGKTERSLEDASISIEAVPDQTYTGRELRPAVTIRDGGYTLVEGADYSLSYSNNVDVPGVGGAQDAGAQDGEGDGTRDGDAAQPAGRPTIAIEGAGIYGGTRIVYFDIVPMPISSCEVSPIEATWCAEGMPAQPKPEVIRPSDLLPKPVLKEGRDYELRYENNTSAGTARVVISGKGNYAGEASREFAVDCAADGLSGSGTAADPYVIGSAPEVEFVALAVNGGDASLARYARAHYVLSGDVDTTKTSPTDSIGTADHPFSGVFDGAGHTVTRNLTTAGKNAALFAYTRDAVIASVTMEGSVATTDYFNVATSALVARATGSLEMDGCVNRAKLAAQATCMGGLVGQLAGGTSVSFGNCRNEAGFGVRSADGGSGFVGGLVGSAAADDIVMADCSNSGAMRADEEAGGLIGRVAPAPAQVKLRIRRCYNTGAVTVNLGGGGLVGSVAGNAALAISDSYSRAQVKGHGIEDYIGGVGGLVGDQQAGTLSIAASYNGGVVSGNGSAVPGGLVGELASRVSSATVRDSLFYSPYPKASVGIDSSASLDDASQGMDMAGLRSDAALQVLGDAFGADAGNRNNGLPILESQKDSIAAYVVSLDGRWTYTGKAVEPAVTLTDPDTFAVLERDRDFAVVYQGNVDAGTATAYVVGIGGYTGRLSANFEIAPASLEDCTVARIADQPLVDGGARPEPLLTDASGNVLAAGTDFAISYVGNAAVGRARAVMVGLGNYTGTAFASFNVVARKALASDDVAPIPEQRYTGGEVTPAVTVESGGTPLAEGTDYEVSYVNNVGPGTAYAVVDGVGLYAGTVRVPFSIAKADIGQAVAAPIDDVLFDGEAATPAVSVRFGSTPLVEGTDFTVSYEGNDEPGEAFAKVVGMGLYGGRLDVPFTILSARITRDCIAPIAAATYAGKPVEPAVRVSFNGRDLVEGTDFKVIYSNNGEPGTGVATVVGIGSYTGEAQAVFSILAGTSDGAGAGQGGSGASPAVKVGSTVEASSPSGPVRVRMTAAGKAMLVKAPAAATSVTVETVTIGGKLYTVTAVGARAFSGCAAKKVVLGKNVKTLKKSAFAGAPKLSTVVAKTTKLKKGSVKGCFKGSKVKTVKVKVGSKAKNRKYVRKYAKTLGRKSVSGKKAKVA